MNSGHGKISHRNEGTIYITIIVASVDTASRLRYRDRVPRTDENGRHLVALLNYLLDGRVTNQQIYQALGMSSSGYYRRIKQDDFPNADELHRLADTFRLSFPDLQVRLGFVTDEDLEGYIWSKRLSISASPRLQTDNRLTANGLADGLLPTPHAAR